MIILDRTDSAKCNSEKISFQIQNNTIEYELDCIEKMSVLTTDKGPFEDDMALAIFVPNEVYIIESEHPLYKNFLFEELGKQFTLNYEAIIEASTCIENGEFVIFTK